MALPGLRRGDRAYRGDVQVTIFMFILFGLGICGAWALVVWDEYKEGGK